jgi:hypothetical protein
MTIMKKHKHHHPPRHRVGDHDNVIELTPTQHAMWHWCEYQMYGLKADYLAWRALSHQTSFSEASKEAWRDGTKRGGETQGRKNVESGHLNRISRIQTERRDKARRECGKQMADNGSLHLAREQRFCKQYIDRFIITETMLELSEGGFMIKDMVQFINLPRGTLERYAAHIKHKIR